MKKYIIFFFFFISLTNIYSQSDTSYIMRDSSIMKINSIWYGGYTSPHKKETYFNKIDTSYILREDIIYNDTHKYSTPLEITKYIDGSDRFNVRTTFFYTEESANEYKENIHARIFQFDCIKIVETWNVYKNENKIYAISIVNADNGEYIMNQTFVEAFKRINEDEKVFYYNGSNNIKLWLNEDYTVAKIKLTKCALKKSCKENYIEFYSKDINELLKNEILTYPIFEEWYKRKKN